MKEFIKNLLILLSTPLYLLAAIFMFVFMAAQKIGDSIMYYVIKWINFMKEDYKKVYEVIKDGSKKTKKR